MKILFKISCATDYGWKKKSRCYSNLKYVYKTYSRSGYRSGNFNMSSYGCKDMYIGRFLSSEHNSNF